MRRRRFLTMGAVAGSGLAFGTAAAIGERDSHSATPTKSRTGSEHDGKTATVVSTWQTGVEANPVAAAILASGGSPLDAAQRRKLGKVLRLRRGDALRVFDGGMGEWLASYEEDCVIAKERTRAPATATPLELFFAPIKKKRTSLLIEKAVELGATSLRPAGTRVRMSRAGGVRTASTPSTRRLLAARCRGCRLPRHRRDSPRR